MKKISTLVLSLIMVFTLVACAPKSEGLYSQQYVHNHTDMTDPLDYTYTLEIFSDGTYRMNYETRWAIPVVTLVYGRDITAYGEYEVKEENAEEGTITYTLLMPTRITMIHEERSSVSAVVDTDNWPAGDPDNDVAPGFTYTLNARAETEVWEKAEDFIAAYGRSYEVIVDTVIGSMKVTVVNGEQIPGDAAVKLPDAATE